MYKAKYSVSVAQLVATKDNICMDRSSNHKFSISPYLKCVNLAVKLLDKTNKQLWFQSEY